MFGKRGMTESDRFVMARGKAVGNLKDAKKTAPKEQPPKKADSKAVEKAPLHPASDRRQLGTVRVKASA